MKWKDCALLLAFLLGCLSAAGKSPEKSEAVGSKAPFAVETFEAVWLKIYEHHFDTNYNGHNWLEVRDMFRPRAEKAQNTTELRRMLQEMIDLLHVSHMAIVPSEISELIETKGKQGDAAVEQAEEEDRGTVGLEVRFSGSDLLVTKVEPDLPAARAGVKPGWIIRKIGGASVAKLLPDELGRLDAQRRQFLTWRVVAKKLSGTPGSSVEVEFRDERDKSRTIKLARQQTEGEAVQFGSLPVIYTHFFSEKLRTVSNRSAGMIRFDIWMLPTAIGFNRAIDELRNCDGLVIDLRGNVGGMVGMIIGTAGHFLREPATLGALVARDNTFTLPANPRFVGASGQPVMPYAGPVAILVDEITASASEVFAGGMQELGRVRVFGRRTSGQALPAVMDELPNGDAFYHPISDFVTPKGTRFEGQGVIPDTELPLKRKALLENQDADLAAALAWIDLQRQ